MIVNIPKAVFLIAYQHLLDSDCDINFLWGGRDSGKTHFIAQKLIVDCLQLPYFRCVLIKKTQESIKDSQWQTIRDIVEQWGLSHLFEFRISPLEISCVNGNKFITRGCDNPQKIKSIANPSHAWYEEGDHLTQSDYITASTTLRSDTGRVQEWFSFNPECKGFEDFWIFKDYLSVASYNSVGYFEKKTAIGELSITIKYSSTHTDYKINKHCTLERAAKLEALFNIDPFYYNVYCRGHWGKKQIVRPFAHNFNYEKHVSESAIFRKNLPVRLLFDFNVNPFVCVAGHIWNDTEGQHVHFFHEFFINNGDVYKMCQDEIIPYFETRANKDYILANLMLTGDATSRKKEVVTQNNQSAWQLIVKILGINISQVHLPRANPLVSSSRILLNTILALHTDFKFHPSLKNTISDMMSVETDENGDILKKDRNKIEQRSDYLDAVRYGANTWLGDFIHKIKP